MCALFALLLWASIGQAQSVPVSPERPWRGQHIEEFQQRLRNYPEPHYDMDDEHIYSLADLVDLAESHNPETRAAWQNAKMRGADLGIARSALYPTITAVALASTTRTGVLLGDDFHRQTVGLLLTEIDPRPYAYALERAKSEQKALEGQIIDESRNIAAQNSGVAVAEAGVHNADANVERASAAVDEARASVANAQAGLSRAEADLAYATNNLHRLELHPAKY